MRVGTVLALTILALGCRQGPSKDSGRSEPAVEVYLDNGTSQQAKVTIDGKAVHIVPPYSFVKVSVPVGKRQLIAEGNSGPIGLGEALLQGARRYVFNIGVENRYGVFTAKYTTYKGPGGPDPSTYPRPEEVGAGEALFALPDWYKLELNQRYPESITVYKGTNELEYRYVYHKPIHHDRPCCATLKGVFFPGDIQGMIESGAALRMLQGASSDSEDE